MRQWKRLVLVLAAVLAALRLATWTMRWRVRRLDWRLRYRARRRRWWWLR